MSQWLVPCSSCARHVNANEVCPFCGTMVEGGKAPTELNVRLSRAAMIGLGAAVVLATGCGQSPSPAYGAPVYDTGVQTDAMTQDQGGPAPAYGAVPVDGR